MIISVASGKGGTGKTTIAVNLALSLNNVQFLDCDVEEPNAHIFLKPEIKEKLKAFIPVPQVDKTRCTYCGKCRQVCEYNAIAVLPKSAGNEGKVLIFAELCHGCGACAMLCPEQAIIEVNKEIGEIEKIILNLDLTALLVSPFGGAENLGDARKCDPFPSLNSLPFIIVGHDSKSAGTIAQTIELSEFSQPKEDITFVYRALQHALQIDYH